MYRDTLVGGQMGFSYTLLLFFSVSEKKKKKKKNFEQIYLENKYKELAVLFSGTPEY